MFNKDKRTNNAIKASISGTICNVANTLFGFVYRTIFLYVLSASYLGINGLFSNILQILSFADLGIGNAIIFRFYKPISENNEYKVGQLMVFFKTIYRVIVVVILFAGMSLFPFLNFFIKDANELPKDINLNLIYLLFLFQTASSYLFVYKQTILNADQKQYIVSLENSIVTLLRYVFQIIVLFVTKNFVLVLAINIIWTVLSNFIFSLWVEKKYKSVFAVKENISNSEKKEIFNDTKATLCHKVGGVVLNSTDNIVISKFVGIISAGIYSNYSLLFSSLNTLLNQLIGSFTSSLGNAHVEQAEEQKYASYKRLLFANLWITSVCTICLYTLINDFIINWVGEDMVLSNLTVIALSLQFFIETSRIISISYTNGCGLFVRDKIRPLIEAAINLVVSIILVKTIGISGVFFGTIISHLCTVTWREPYLLYKYEFKKNWIEYWEYYFSAFGAVVIFSLIFAFIFGNLHFAISNFLMWVIKAAIVFVLSNIFLIAILHKNSDYLFFKNLIIGLINKVFKRRNV